MDATGNLRCWKECVAIAKYLSKIHRYYSAVVIFWRSLQLAKRSVLSQEETLKLLDCLRDLIQLGDQVRKVNKKEKKATESDVCFSIALFYLDRRAKSFQIYYMLGCANVALSNYTSAVKWLKKSIAIAKTIENKSWELQASHPLGQALCGSGEAGKKAKGHLERHLVLAEEFGDKRQKCLAYLNLGNYHHDVAEYKVAIDYHNKQLVIAKELTDKALQRHAYGVLGRAYSETGQTERAIKNLEKSLRLAKEEGDKTAEGEAYGNLGNAYKSKGSYGKAIEHFEKSRHIAFTLHDKDTEANALCNLGSTYRHIGEFDKAIRHFHKFLTMAEEMGNKAEEAKACHNLGNAYLHLGQSTKGIKYLEKALEMLKATGRKGDTVHVYGTLVVAVNNAEGNNEKGLQYTQEYLKRCKEINYHDGEKVAVANLGTIFLNRRNFTEAIRYHEIYLNLNKETEAKEGEANAHTMLGLDHEMQGDYKRAKSHYLCAIELREEIQQDLRNRDDYKVSIGELQDKDYRNLSRVLIISEEHEEALAVVERGRSRALADLMTSSYCIQTASEDGERKTLNVRDIKATVERSGVTTIAMSEANDSFLFLWVVEPNGGIHLQPVSEQIPPNSNETGFKSIISSLSFYQKTVGEQRMLHCEDRSLANMYEGQDQKLTEVGPISDELELRFGFLKSVQKRVVAETLTCLREPYTSESEDNSQALRRLYNIIITPVVDFLRVPEILLVLDGSFHKVPLAALKDERGRFLSESHRIRVLPSLKTLMLIQESPPEYHNQSGALIVGDPEVGKVEFQGKVERLARLDFARKEAEMIGHLLHVAPLIGDQATKEEVLKQMTTVALIHIAAHGDMESGEIALAPNPNRTSQIPREKDYILSMADVHNARLRAKLVVLSSCHSGRGKIKAEGVVGIARAFLGAGARSVLVSLWAVDDEATMMFMRSFYEHLHGGKSASEALQQAMKCLRESQQFSDEKHWAPFVLIGDDVRLEF